jgi:hypothetical protein
MPEKLKTALDAWRAADAKCKHAEHELSSAMDRFIDGGPPVAAELIARVAMLRTESATLLRESIDEMRASSTPQR